jgi:predicted MPP superfamily phosphohydrolase
MKRTSRIILFVIVGIILTGIYLILRHSSPKNADYFPILALLVLLDIYLWNSFRWIRKRVHHFPNTLFWILYWSPFLIICITVLLSGLIGFSTSNNPFLIYLMGFVFVMYVAKILPAFLLLADDIVRGIRLLVIRIRNARVKNQEAGSNTISRNKFIQYAGLLTGGLVSSGFIAGMIKWVNDFRIHQHQISLPQLPEVFRGLRIVQISDIHLGSWPSESSLDEIAGLIEDQDPDIVFFTGDLVNLYTSEAFPFEQTLQRIKARLGVFAVLGNHDYGDYATWDSQEAKDRNMAEMEDFIKRIGWNLLRNRHELIEIQGEKLAIIGVDNWSVYTRFKKLGDMQSAVSEMENTPVKLLLSHDPSHWDEEIIKSYPDIDITFSGHTHGFQFGIESGDFQWSPVQYLYKHWAGMYEHIQPDGNIQYLYVNRGLGTIGYPGRIGISPEITLFVLD